MSFIALMRNSIYNPGFYRGILAEKISWSIKYFFLLALLFALIVTGIFSLELLGPITSFIHDIGPTVVSTYPDGLEVRIEKGEATTNVSEPYVIPLPENLRGSIGRRYPSVRNAIVIDTTRPFSYDLFTEHNAIVLLSKKTIAASNESRKITVQPLGEFPNFVLTKAKLQSFISRIEPFLKFIPPLFVIALFAGMSVYFSLNLSYLFIAALLIWVIFKIKKIDAGYLKAYQIGIHAMTLPFFLQVLGLLLAPGLELTFVFTGVLLAIVWINVKPTTGDQPTTADSGQATSS